MAVKKTGRYKVLRDWDGHVPGDLIDVDDDQAALLIRDGMIVPAEQEA